MNEAGTFTVFQYNGNEDIYKRIRREIEVGVRPPVANWNKPWGNL